MIVLGIGGSAHDFSACLVVDGEVKVAVEEERLSRIKHHSLERLGLADMRLQSVGYCLRAVGATLDDVEMLVANDLVFRGVLRCLPAATLVSHHLSHAALVAYLSPHSTQAILVVDGFGSLANGQAETVSYFTTGRERKPHLVHRETQWLHRIDQTRPFSWKNLDFVEHSLGEFYSFVTRGVGFGRHDEGKTMGLAAYGSDRLVPEFLRITDLGPAGEIRFDSSTRHQLGTLIAAERAIDDSWEGMADLARGAQVVVERSLLRRVADVYGRTGLPALAVSGGVFLNALANQQIREQGPFDAFYLHGATGDSGTAIGAALLGYHHRTGTPPQPAEVIYTGRRYPRQETLTVLESTPGIAWTEVDNVCDRAASVLALGGVVGWFQGGSEFGPRALGNRSILADPSRPEMKARINSVVKHREDFRPFAPAVLEDRQVALLQTDAPSLYMCINSAVRPEAMDSLIAASHIDGSARYQTVTGQTNPRFYELIARFYALTGVPSLLNTSFNDDEPIVESPADALRCFTETQIDCLVIDDFFITRS